MVDYEKIIVQWKEFEIPKALERDINVPLKSEFIISIIGPRRAGKTYVCFCLINDLLKDIPKEHILYLNFEDEKLLGINAEDLDKLLNTFYELSNTEIKTELYLFLDEIQNVKNWDVWTRRIHDMHKNIHLFLTGSSSKLLSKEISTSLRGRVIPIEIYPLSFKELLKWKKIDYDLKTLSNSNQRFNVKKVFNEYLNEGGYPALFKSLELKQQILQSYLESIILKDVIERYNIRDFKELKILSNLLFENVAKDLSYTKLSNTLSSLGYKLNKKTVIDYISYFEEAYLFFQSLRYEYSLRKQLGSIKKVYCIDNGLLNTVSFKFSEDRGRLLENLVFLELKRRGKKIFYNRDTYECDFIIQEKDKIVEAVQVTEKFTAENEKRETEGLLEAMRKFNLKEGIIITLNEEKNIEIENKKIYVQPIWKWLLV
ncbi:MAG: ATP-binding protein [archaeon]